MGRPTDYSEDLASRILGAIATSTDGLPAICASESDFPEPRTIYRWLLTNEAFSQAYARAKEDQLRILEDQILQIADTTQLGEIVTLKADGTEERKLADMLEHRKLQIESRKWLMGKLKPKKYGDRVAHTGEDGGPLQFTLTRAGR